MSPKAEVDELDAIMRLVPVAPHEAARRLHAMGPIYRYQSLAVAVSMVVQNVVKGNIVMTAVIPGEQQDSKPSAH